MMYSHILSCKTCDGNENSLMYYSNSCRVWYWVGSGTQQFTDEYALIQLWCHKCHYRVMF